MLPFPFAAILPHSAHVSAVASVPIVAPSSTIGVGAIVLDAVITNDVDALRTLLQAFPAYANAVDDDGITVLMVAAQRGRVEIIEILCRADASVNAQSQDGMSAFMFAAAHDQVDAMETLLDYGPEVEATTAAGNNALMIAVEHDQMSAAVFLLDLDMPVNVTNHEGDTSMHLAAGNDSPA